MLNRNRCILCTRCVRFMRDVEGDAQINIIDRGYGSEIATFQEEGVHSLISGNLMDVCPVGAITTRDYRFKSRPWDNPKAVDTICTLCSKGCSTTAWLKAKPEWAKGSRLIRFTPRFNPDVNGYWMCDIGRFDYHWIEGDDRLQRPLGARSAWRRATGLVARAALDVAGSARRRRDRRTPRGCGSCCPRTPRTRSCSSSGASPASSSATPRRRLPSAGGIGPSLSPTARRSGCAAVDAPNVNGARMLGLAPGTPGDEVRAADISALKDAVDGGRVSALYVFDPGPDGSIGDTAWIVDARARGVLPLLIVHGVVVTDLVRAADFVLPGASYVEKDASYSNDQGRLQGAARAIGTPGEAMEDWQILVNLGVALGVAFDYASPAHIRAAIATEYAQQPGFATLATLTFGRPVAARHWLQASNPSERWKWDFMFQDLPPVKGAVDPLAVPMPISAIPLREVK